MSYVQWVEEQEYDTESEYRNVLRQENYDPEEHFFICSHGVTQSYRVEDGGDACETCDALAELRDAVHEALDALAVDPWQDVPF